MELERYINKFFTENNMFWKNEEIFNYSRDSFWIEKNIRPISILNNSWIIFSILKNINEDLNTLLKENIKKYKKLADNFKKEKLLNILQNIEKMYWTLFSNIIFIIFLNDL